MSPRRRADDREDANAEDFLAHLTGDPDRFARAEAQYFRACAAINAQRLNESEMGVVALTALMLINAQIATLAHMFATNPAILRQARPDLDDESKRYRWAIQAFVRMAKIMALRTSLDKVDAAKNEMERPN